MTFPSTTLSTAVLASPAVVFASLAAFSAFVAAVLASPAVAATLSTSSLIATGFPSTVIVPGSPLTAKPEIVSPALKMLPSFSSV